MEHSPEESKFMNVRPDPFENAPSQDPQPAHLYRYSIGNDPIPYEQQGATATGDSSSQQDGQQLQQAVTQNNESTGQICGLRKSTFWLTVSNVLLLIALVVAAAVEGRVLGGRHEGRVSSSCPTPAADAVTTTTSAATSASATSSTSSTTKPPSSNPTVCFDTTQRPPKAGDPKPECDPTSSSSSRLSNYTVPGTNLTFDRRCGTDFPGNDIGLFPVWTMEDCLALCAQLNLYPASSDGSCIGVAWVYGDGPQGQGLSFCFPKNFTAGAKARTGTESAVLIDGG